MGTHARGAPCAREKCELIIVLCHANLKKTQDGTKAPLVDPMVLVCEDTDHVETMRTLRDACIIPGHFHHVAVRFRLDVVGGTNDDID